MLPAPSQEFKRKWTKCFIGNQKTPVYFNGMALDFGLLFGLLALVAVPILFLLLPLPPALKLTLLRFYSCATFSQKAKNDESV
jgi:hypothetical protein